MSDSLEIRLADFGSSFPVVAIPDSGDIVPRHYRPPEVILKGKVGLEVDVWSAGICLFELATGKRPFEGIDQTDMLRQFWENGVALEPSFLLSTEAGSTFCNWKDQAGLTEGNGSLDLSIPPKAGKMALKRLVISHMHPSEQGRAVADFYDLLSQMLTADPCKRLSANDALNYPFFLG